MKNRIELNFFLIFRNFYLAPDEANLGVFRYNEEIDTNSQILLNSYTEDMDLLLQAFDNIPYNGSGNYKLDVDTFICRALFDTLFQHTLNVIPNDSKSKFFLPSVSCLINASNVGERHRANVGQHCKMFTGLV